MRCRCNFKGSALELACFMLQNAIRRTLLIAERAGIRAMLTHSMDEDAARLQRMPRNNADVGSSLRLVTGQFVPLVTNLLVDISSQCG